MIVYNGKSLLKEFRTVADESQARVKPTRSEEKISVVGRSGDLTISNDRFENVQVPFNCTIRRNFNRYYDALMGFLLSESGYHRLEISSQADFYRMARFAEPASPDPGQWSKTGQFTLTFDCMPQRWYKSGENVIENPSALVNPSYYAAKPLIRCHGAGVLKVGGDTITISKHSHAYIDIDSERMNCYCGAINCNDYVEMTDYPELHGGTTHMSFTGTKFEVTPRWWTI